MTCRPVTPAMIFATLAACSMQEPANNTEDPSAPPAVLAPAAPGATGTTPTPPFAETPGAHPDGPPEPAPIPAIFRGTWADDTAACADLKHPSRLTISGRTVRHPNFVIFGDQVTASGNSFALKGHIEATGARAEAHYSLNPASNVLTDEAGGGAIRIRCG
jgi:hypothetical protein